MPKRFFALLLILPLLTACTSSTLDPTDDPTAFLDAQDNLPTDNPDPNLMQENEQALLPNQVNQTALPAVGEEIAVVETNFGTMRFRLFYDATPVLAKNFADLARSGKYDNVPFHRVVKDFMVQSGDYTNFDGTGGGSFSGAGLADEYHTDLTHLPGALAMAKSSFPNSIGSQFYIVNGANGAHGLDGRYSVIGQMIDGLDTLQAISNVPVEDNGQGEISRPTVEVKIIKVTLVPYEATEDPVDVEETASDEE